jgi:3-(3-hydroxy-phenyl)propionate hydroxylase
MKVIISGAGPVGLTTALALAREGIAVTVLERAAELATDLRASTWHPPTLDMMGELGLVDEILRDGLIARTFQVRDRQTGAIAEFDMGLLKGETNHPYRVQYEQFRFTQLVASRLAAFPHAKLVFNAKVASVSQDPQHIRVTAEDGTVYEADWLIGSDGAYSSVRSALGIEFPGLTFPERFFVISTPFPLEDHLNRLSYVNYVADTDEWCVLLKVPGLWRCLFPTSEESDEEVLASGERRLQSVFSKAEPYETRHKTLYRVHQRVAETYRKGRAFLAGDAAHLNNPIGGMGMNGGLHDGLNLAGKLVELNRSGSDRLADYEPERRPVAVEHINATTARNREMLAERDPAARKRKQDELCRTAEDPVAAKAYLMKSSMINTLRRAA